MKWNIVADSSCDLRSTDITCEEVGFSTIPFVLRIDDKDFVDTEDMNVLEMVEAMENSKSVCRSSCPSPADFAEQFGKAENTFAITISSNLSGSHNSAVVAKDMVLSEAPEKKIEVLDSFSTGPESALCIYKLRELIREGHTFEHIADEAKAFLKTMKTSFALCSFDNLVKNGRMSKFTGFVARKLGMWGFGIASDIGTIVIKGKSRGPKNALKLIIDDMIERGFNGGLAAISHCANSEMAEKLRAAIVEKWNTAKVTIFETRGLDSFYAERGGLIITFG